MWVKCGDLDLAWAEEIEDEDPKHNLVVDTYLSDLSTLSWFGWWGGQGEFEIDLD